jgi:hypothetical protein
MSDRQKVVEEVLRKSINEGLNVNPIMPRNILPKNPPKSPPSSSSKKPAE